MGLKGCLHLVPPLFIFQVFHICSVAFDFPDSSPWGTLGHSGCAWCLQEAEPGEKVGLTSCPGYPSCWVSSQFFPFVWFSSLTFLKSESYCMALSISQTCKEPPASAS